MRTVAPFLTLTVSALLGGFAHGEERGRPEVQALVHSMKKVAAEAAGSVACVLVSRSDEYHTAPYWGQPAGNREEGQLGPFDAEECRRRVPENVRHRARILASIRAHDLSDPRNVPESFGSGFVVAPGLVLTNAHVVKGATKVHVRLPGGRGSWADLHASDPRSDLAVLRLLDPPPDLKPLSLGKAEKVAVGQPLPALLNLYAPGFPNAEATFSWGVVSALRQRAGDARDVDELKRHKVTLHHYGTLIQTDARLTPGCSGGVLLSQGGEVVGLTTALLAVRGTDSSGALGIPFDASTREIVAVLLRGEEVEYGFLGVALKRADLPPRRGIPVEIERVSGGSPAARAGLQTHDIIQRINGRPVEHNDDLFLYIGMALAGKPAELEVATRARGGLLVRKVTVELAKFYVPGPVIASKRPPARGGLRVDYTSLLAQRGPFLGWNRSIPEGVIIREVVPGSSADKALLQPDKVITHVNGTPVRTPEAYYRAVAKARDTVVLRILNSEARPEEVRLDLK